MNGSLRVKCYRNYFFVQILDAIADVAYTFVVINLTLNAKTGHKF